MSNPVRDSSNTNTITVAHIFYGQHRMLPLHDIAWQKKPSDRVRYVIVDDCSLVPITAQFSTKNLDIYRVKNDIPWNIAGARNLCFYVADTEWVLCADVDHIVTPEAFDAILKLDRSDSNVVYTFARRDSDGYLGKDAIINILMNKQKYFEIGGHDEDFSGRYGREETFFLHCLRANKINVIKCDDIILEWHPKVGATLGLIRDKSENAVIFDKKMSQLKTGTYNNGPILRFEWQHIKSSSK